MAKETVEAFPMTPSEIVIPSNKHLLSELRKEMAVTILESSGMYCMHTINNTLALIFYCGYSFTTYSGYVKYSDPLKFFTLCYIAAIC